MSRPGIDDALHNTSRLRVAAFLSGCDEAEFRAVREYCDLTPSALSKIVSTLQDVAYIAIRKGYVGKMPRTWLSLTRVGRNALTTHLDALARIANSAHDHAHITVGHERD